MLDMDGNPCPFCGRNRDPGDFEAWWMRTPIPGEYDSWDDCDRQRWRAVCRSAFEAGAATASPSPTAATP